MPRGNRTGPAGMGPMTGRAAGYCAPGFMNPALGYGRGLPGYGPAYTGGRPGGWSAPAYYGAFPAPGFFRGRRFGFGPGFGFGPAWGRGRRGRW